MGCLPGLLPRAARCQVRGQFVEGPSGHSRLRASSTSSRGGSTVTYLHGLTRANHLHHHRHLHLHRHRHPWCGWGVSYHIHTSSLTNAIISSLARLLRERCISCLGSPRHTTSMGFIVASAHQDYVITLARTAYTIDMCREQTKTPVLMNRPRRAQVQQAYICTTGSCFQFHTRRIYIVINKRLWKYRRHKKWSYLQGLL